MPQPWHFPAPMRQDNLFPIKNGLCCEDALVPGCRWNLGVFPRDGEGFLLGLVLAVNRHGAEGLDPGRWVPFTAWMQEMGLS